MVEDIQFGTRRGRRRTFGRGSWRRQINLLSDQVNECRDANVVNTSWSGFCTTYSKRCDSKLDVVFVHQRSSCVSLARISTHRLSAEMNVIPNLCSNCYKNSTSGFPVLFARTNAHGLEVGFQQHSGTFIWNTRFPNHVPHSHYGDNVTGLGLALICVQHYKINACLIARLPERDGLS
jgi:hypothetical protein